MLQSLFVVSLYQIVLRWLRLFADEHFYLLLDAVRHFPAQHSYHIHPAPGMFLNLLAFPHFHLMLHLLQLILLLVCSSLNPLTFLLVLADTLLTAVVYNGKTRIVT